MSTSGRLTRGPLPPSVYWRRRLFVLGTVAALVLLVVEVVRGDPAPPAERAVDRTSAGAAALAGSTAPGSAPSADDTTSGAKGRNGKGKGKGKGNGKRGDRDGDGTAGTPDAAPPTHDPEPVLAQPTGRCADDDVAISPFVSGAVAGRPVTITLRLRTLTSPACTWKLSADHLALKISRADKQVWATWQCPRQVPQELVTVRREVTATVELVWNARHSDTGCPRNTDWAAVGEYDVTAATFGGEPMDTRFTLAQPVVTRRG